MKRIVMRNNIGLGPETWLPYDNEKQLVYGRIAGGIGWPGKKPGAAVVAAQEMVMRRHESAPVHIIGVAQRSDLGELLDDVLELKSQLIVDDGFYCDTRNEAAMSFLLHRRRQFRSKKNIFRYRSAGIGENECIERHLLLLREHLKPSNKLVWLEEYPQFASALSGLPDDITGLKPADHPLIAALVFSIYDLIMNPMSDDRMRRDSERKKLNEAYLNDPIGFRKNRI